MGLQGDLEEIALSVASVSPAKRLVKLRKENPMAVPANVLSFYAESRWGNRFGLMAEWYSSLGHRGHDIYASGGQDIPALRAGVVRLTQRSPYLGGTVCIESGPGDFSAYCHLAGIRVSEGESVAQGQIIGQAASNQADAGSSWDGPHLHMTRGPDNQAAFGGPGLSDPAPLIREILGGASGGGNTGGGSGGIQISIAQGKILQRVAQKGNYQGDIDGVPGVNTWKGIQTVLTAKNFYSGPIDGIVGPNTWKGVQRLAQLGGYGGLVDGFPGTYTYQGLENWLNSSPTTTPPPAGFQGVYGVDVGTSQRGFDFQALRAAGYQFAIVKAGGSNVVPTYVAPHYVTEVSRVRAAGLLVGHYWMVGSNTPAVDAAYFLDNLFDYRAGDILALDNEAINTGRKWTDAEAAVFMRAVKTRLGYVPFMYINRADLSGSSWPEVRALGAKLWIAAPDGVPGTVNITAFSDWAIHQYSWTGNQNGTDVDLNVAKLSAFAGLTQPPNGVTGPPAGAIPGNGGSGGATPTISISIAEGKILQTLAKRGNYGGEIDGIPGTNTWKGVQNVLTDLEYYSGPVDGVPGRNTYIGLQLVAKVGDYSGAVDGIPGPATWAGIAKYLSDTAGGAPDSYAGTILQRLAKAGGYTGAVDGAPGTNTWKGVQQVLAGYKYRGPIDGAMGTMSWAALQRFAAKGGYTGIADGVMGTNSWAGVQVVLANFGYGGAADGAPGTNTYRALQRIAKLGGYRGPLDGVMGPRSWAGLQTFLYGVGYTGPLDGVPGTNTYKAMQSMASRGGYQGLIDGIPGPLTYGGLQELLA
ncbi:peptidase M23 (plasmid) [Cryobacterium sp. LW097]|nr:peptidase M23 [Cryobacterium sp. LW097]TFC52820.1 peptidase M23 [Cryobacterium sp. TMB3-1-2]TFC62239.1 peptidase M23 [Cryobacterium sp. TMB1-7]TFC70670.1 peptidase M23 [Cryobacterium sp. TMB3-15]TFC75396.1 peptidase M23 [Cryobacterium sp. TMB3-10]TFD37598.1 peptidase M23 [Cryobacterium sp. TMB3-12]